MTYNALGHRQTQTDARGNTTEFFYDSLYRPLATKSPEGVVITSTYNVAGQVLTSTNNLGHAVRMQYDELGRLVRTIDAEQNETQYEYDVLGNQVAVVDANDIRTSYQYDALRRLEMVIENDTGGNQTDESNIATHYTYDVLGSQISIINGRDITVSTVGYDDLYRPTVITDALDHTSSSQYNALGMKLSTTDANGDVTSYGYDGLNRPITVTYETDGETVLYAYNALGSRIMMTGQRQLKLPTDDN